MKSRSESLIRLKKFQVDEKRRQVAQIEMMIADFERMAVLDADDFGRENVLVDRLDLHAPAHAQFAHRTDDFDQQALHRFDPAEHLDVVNRLDSRDQRFHAASLSPDRGPTMVSIPVESRWNTNHTVTHR